MCYDVLIYKGLFCYKVMCDLYVILLLLLNLFFKKKIYFKIDKDIFIL